MNKVLKYLESFTIILVIILTILLFVIFNKHIKSENIDTSYMWNIKFDNLSVTKGSIDTDINLEDNNLNLDITLKEGEFLEFTLDIINDGNLDAIVNNINFNVENKDNVIKYSLSYLDGNTINEGDILKSHNKNTIKVRLEYPNNNKVKEESNLKLSLNIDYIVKK